MLKPLRKASSHLTQDMVKKLYNKGSHVNVAMWLFIPDVSFFFLHLKPYIWNVLHSGTLSYSEVPQNTTAISRSLYPQSKPPTFIIISSIIQYIIQNTWNTLNVLYMILKNKNKLLSLDWTQSGMTQSKVPILRIQVYREVPSLFR